MDDELENRIFRTMLSFDMRAPHFGTPASDIYNTALEMCEFGDRIGIDGVILPEHHGSEDGYNPVPALMATAVSARTKRMAILLGAIVLPLHDPVEVAETIAVADLISGGRLHTTLVAGYVESEFRMFGRSLQDRARLMDEGLSIILRALSGERFLYGDREVFVRPLPYSRQPAILVGGGVQATALRAAKFGLGLWSVLPASNPKSKAIIDLYLQECANLGKLPGPIMTTPPGVFVARDPEKAWTQLSPHIVHLVRSYSAWNSSSQKASSVFHGLETEEAIRNARIINIVTPEECLDMLKWTAISLTLPLSRVHLSILAGK